MKQVVGVVLFALVMLLAMIVIIAATTATIVMAADFQRDLSVGITYGSPPYVSRPRTYVHRASAPAKKITKKKKKVVKEKKPTPTRVMAYVKAIKPTCLQPVRVVGSQGLTDGQAEASAQKAWMEAIRYDHGESMMDLDNAVGYTKRCTRSSIGEIAGQTFHRCEIIATPCRAIMSSGR